MEGKASSQTSVGRGRPSKGGGLARTAVGNEFAARKARGELADKREANIQAAIDWTRDILGIEVSRSSAQRWLKDIV